jgi:hypothetical protein
MLGNENFMKDSSKEADNDWVRQKIRHLLLILEEYYSLQKIPPLGSILRHINPILPSNSIYIYNIHFNIILRYTPISPKRLLSSGFPTETVYALSPLYCLLRHLPTCNPLGFVTIISGDEYNSWSPSVSSVTCSQVRIFLEARLQCKFS